MKVPSIQFDVFNVGKAYTAKVPDGCKAIIITTRNDKGITPYYKSSRDDNFLQL